jgi:hypothetical protein
MGPNGSGKSTLAHALAGHPGYKVLGRLGAHRRRGTVDDVADGAGSPRSPPGDAAALGGPGVRPIDLLVAAGADPTNLRERMRDEAERVELRPEMLDRFVNVDLSGGERKRAEMVQFGSCVRSSRCSTRSTPGSTSTPSARSRDASRSRPPSGSAASGDHALQASVARAHADDDPRAERGARRRDRRAGTLRDPRTRRLRAVPRRVR